MDEVFEENTAGSVNSTPVISSSTQKKLPRKRFKWNEETKYVVVSKWHNLRFAYEVIVTLTSI